MKTPVIRNMEKLCSDSALWIATERGLRLDDISQRRLIVAVGHAMQRAALSLQAATGGWFQSRDSLGNLEHPVNPSPVLFDDLLRGCIAEKHPAQKTIYTWTKVCHTFVEFVGHGDASRVTPDDFIRWKESLVAEGLETSTIRDGKIGPLKAIMQWGFANRKLKTNPAAKITVGQRTGAGIRGFNDGEAETIVQAAMLSVDPVKHWVPLLGCWTGARISEISQLRREDVITIEGIICIRLAHEAGQLKTTSSERIIPVHPSLVDAGFIKYAQKIKEGPLFKDLTPDRFGNRGGNATKIISRWVRSLGIVDKRISPSHSWRHQFKTLCRKYGVPLDIADALTGHGKKNVSAQYGEFPVSALYREIQKIPCFDLAKGATLRSVGGCSVS